MIRSSELDRHFAHEVMSEPGGEHLMDCWSCGTCAATCLVRRFEEFNPRLILRQAGMGMREAVLSSNEIWLCSACDACYPRCPKGIHISDVMKAIRSIAVREGYSRPGPTAQVNIPQCVACGMCVAACPYEAIHLEVVQNRRQSKRAAQVDANLCMGCGICTAVCPSYSVSLKGHTDGEIHRSIVAKTAVRPPGAAKWNGKVLVIACNWSLHANVDEWTAANPPEGVEVIRVPCSGRVSPVMILNALKLGVTSVLIVGCNDGECHYREGNRLEATRLTMLSELLDVLGIEPQRVQFARMGSLDRGKFAALVKQAVESAQQMGALTGSVREATEYVR